MKKNRINAFTLVEMLIVIVIIGILIAALLPRMQAAQGRARDVSRKTALSQIQSAIVVSQGDKGAWPGMKKNGSETNEALNGMNVKQIKGQLEAAGLNGIPEDPLKSLLKGLGPDQAEADKGQYRYMVLPRNGTPAGGFILMAKTEVEGGSNWVYCETTSDAGDVVPPSTLTGGFIAYEGDDPEDLTNIIPCVSVSEKKSNEECGKQTDGSCRYENEGQLRYIITY